MSMREIPKSFVYGCDICGAEQTLEYDSSLPPHWFTVTIRSNNSPEFGHYTYEALLLCQACGPPLVDPIRKAKEEINARNK